MHFFHGRVKSGEKGEFIIIESDVDKIETLRQAIVLIDNNNSEHKRVEFEGSSGILLGEWIVFAHSGVVYYSFTI